jgi:hypothetical protein
MINHQTDKMQRSKPKRLLIAIVLGALIYGTLIIVSYMTFGLILLPIKSWKSLSDPIPFINTLHFVCLSFLFARYIYRKHT